MGADRVVGGDLDRDQDPGSLRRDERGEASTVSGELDIECLSFELIAQEMVGRGRIGLRQLGRAGPLSALGWHGCERGGSIQSIM